ncbi:MAG: hypothetical protein JWN09_1041 [Microbacteriaceae bacterium]|nr:hypothetical protein [Microbacteriaceae bacterium]
MISRRVVAVVLSVSVLIGVSACTSQPLSISRPSPSVSSTPSPAPTKAVPKAAKITIDRTQMVVLAGDGSTMATIPYTSMLDAAVDQLTKLIGVAPASSSTPESQCSPANTIEAWGDGLKLSQWQTDVGGPYPVTVFSRQKTVGTGISVVTPNGYGVGDSISAFIAASPASSLVINSDSSYGTQVFYDLDPTTNDAAVLLSDVQNGPITMLNAPGNVYQDC